MAKRAFDVVAAAILLAAVSPLMVLLALWIWIERDGPVFFRQQRVGRFGEPFEILKFRTMVPGDESTTERESGITTRGHPRVRTPSGRFLRKTKLDELPQLLNVLKGEMSLVGPRPELEKYVRLYPEDDRRTILSVRPGLTDEAALRFTNEEVLLQEAADPESFYIERILPEKVSLYCEYVRRQSLLYDLRLIILTVAAILAPPVRSRLSRSEY